MKIGIITAMDVEAKLLRSKMTASQEIRYAGVTFWEGKLEGKDVVLFVSGVGKINAAVYTQILIERFAPDAILLSGIAGSMDPKAGHLSVVVAKEFALHDVWEVVKGGRYYQDFYPTDPRLFEALRGVAPDPDLYGLILTGDQFIAEKAVKDQLKARFPASLAVEMEGGAVAHVAHINGVPFGAIRCISDLADDNADETYDNFEDKAAGISAGIMLRALAAL